MRRIVKFCALGTPYGKSGHPDWYQIEMWAALTSEPPFVGKFSQKKTQMFQVNDDLDITIASFQNFYHLLHSMRTSGKAKTQYWNWTGLYYLLYKCAFGNPHYWACTSITIFYRTDKEKRRVIMNCMANTGGMLRAQGRLTLGQEEDVRKRLKAIPNHSKPFYPQFSAHFLFLVFSLAIKLLRWTNNLLENTWKQYLLWGEHASWNFAKRRKTCRILSLRQPFLTISMIYRVTFTFPELMKNMWSNFPGDLIFCVPKKAGSVSLDHFFAMNLDYNDYMSWQNRTVLPAKERFLASTRMMVIRHPFQRLASAFQFIFRYSVEEVDDRYFEHTASVFLSEGIIQHLSRGD